MGTLVPFFLWEVFFGPYSEVTWFVLGILATVVVRFGVDYYNDRKERTRLEDQLRREIAGTEFGELREWIEAISGEGNEDPLEDLATQYLDSDEHDYEAADLDSDYFRTRLKLLFLRDFTPKALDRLKELETESQIYDANRHRIDLLDEEQRSAVNSYYSLLHVQNQFARRGLAPHR